MLDPILSHLPANQQAFVSDLDDPLYWQMRRDNDDFLKRRQWWGRHFARGTLRSQRQRAALELAHEGEAAAARMIRALGYLAHPTTKNCAFDLWAADSQGHAARVEVKTSLYTLCSDPRKGGRYEANIRQNKDTDLLIFLAKNGTWWPYIIPIAAIGQRHNIAIWSYCPGDYKGQWSIYLNAWQHLEQVIQNTHPRAWQLSLPFGGAN